ncbi:putative quinol monooxygenase [Microtetraspora malaysiensis]|uniref:putative quinol monooxygenase n=1 Tax=Microtetraspora malaysiensis TaxID=161358 RepID=UPI00082B071B|nr:antibiotic biosynthesis monooxygenase [Microtetraspora malaysiensis]
MEVLVAVIAFAGAVLAAITTGVVVGRIREKPSGWLVAWGVTTGATCLSLGLIAVGQLLGYGVVIFRLFQITGSLVAPLWLAVGIAQLIARKPFPRFAAWLFGGALTGLGAVIMLIDPVTQAFTKEFPAADVFWDIWPEWLLRAVHIGVIGMLVIWLVIAVLRGRNGDDYDLDNMNATVALAPGGIAVSAALEFTLPGIVVVAAMAATVGGVWFALARPLAPYEDEEEDAGAEQPEDGWSRRGARGAESRAENRAEPSASAPPRRSGLGDLVAEYRAGEQGDVDYAARMQPSDGFAARPAGPQAGQDAYGGARGREYTMPPQAAEADRPAPQGGPEYTMPPGPSEHGRPQGGRPEYTMPATGTMLPGADPAAGMGAGMAAGFAGAAAASRGQGGSVRPSPNIYGLLTVFTLMDGAGDAFDKLAEETVEAVLRNEPDTLVFVCHSVKSAPLQRIVYELYRDEVGYTEHQRQPHMERFATERTALVLAANVIELSVNAAKVVPLPTAFR